MRGIAQIGLVALLWVFAGCGDRDRLLDEADQAWEDFETVSENAQAIQSGAAVPLEDVREAVDPAQLRYKELASRLGVLKSRPREVTETLFTGKTLLLDYQRHVVRMDGHVMVEDDRGELEAEALTGRFSVSNQIELIEASDEVEVRSEGRVANGDTATYVYADGMIQLDGSAQVVGAGSRMTGDRIRFWVRENRRVICSPNAYLELSNAEQLSQNDAEETPQPETTNRVTRVTAERIIFDENKRQALIEGDVVVRDPRAAINCGKVKIYLKENNELDWLEAQSDVIVQSGERKALAEQIRYYAGEEKFVLEGHPMISEGQNVMAGDRITYWRLEDRLVCEPNAKVVFHLDDDARKRMQQDLRE